MLFENEIQANKWQICIFKYLLIINGCSEQENNLSQNRNLKQSIEKKMQNLRQKSAKTQYLHAVKPQYVNFGIASSRAAADLDCSCSPSSSNKEEGDVFAYNGLDWGDF